MSTLSNLELKRRINQRVGNNGSYSPSQASFEVKNNNKILSNPNDNNVDILLSKIKQKYTNVPQNIDYNNLIEKTKKSDEKVNWAKRTGNSVTRLFYNFYDGFWNTVEGIGDALIGVAGEVGSWFGADDTWAKEAVEFDWSQYVARTFTQVPIPGAWQNFANPQMYDKASWDFSLEGMEKYKNELNENNLLADYDNLNQTVGAIEQGLGQVGVQALVASIPGGTGFTLGKLGVKGTAKVLSIGTIASSSIGSSAEGSLIEQEQVSGNSSLSKAMLYGLGSGTVEGLSEYALGWALKGTGKLFSKAGINGSKIANLFPNSVNGLLGKQVSKNVIGQLGKQFIEEGTEEVISDLVDPLLKSIYNEKSIKENYEELQVSDLLTSFLVGGSISAIAGSGEVVSRIRYGKNIYEANIYNQGIINDYQNFIDLTNSNKATTIDKEGNVIYTKEALTLLNNMIDNKTKVEKLYAKMSPSEKNKYFEYLTGKNLDRIFNEEVINTQKLINEYDTTIKAMADNMDNDIQKKQTFEGLINVRNALVNKQENILSSIENFRDDSINEFLKKYEINKDIKNIKLQEDIVILDKNIKKYLARNEIFTKKEDRINLSKQIQQHINNIYSSLKNNEDKINFLKSLEVYKDLVNNLKLNKTINNIDKLSTLEQILDEPFKNVSETKIHQEILKFNAYKTFNKTKIETRIEFLTTLPRNAKGIYDEKTNTIKLSDYYDKDYSSIFAHEYVSHVLFDKFATKERNNILGKILNTKWYKENKDNLLKVYDLPNKELSKYDKAQLETFNSEVFANYLEFIFKEQNNNDNFLFNELMNYNSFTRAFRQLFNKIVPANVDELRLVRDIRKLLKILILKLT